MKQQLNFINTVRTYVEKLYSALRPEYSYDDILLACELAKIFPDPTGNDRFNKIAAYFMHFSDDYIKVTNDYEIDPNIIRYKDMYKVIDWPEKIRFNYDYDVETLKESLIQKLYKKIKEQHDKVYPDLPGQAEIYARKLEEAKSFIGFKKHGMFDPTERYIYFDRNKDPVEKAELIIKKSEETAKILSDLDSERRDILKEIANAKSVEELTTIDYYIVALEDKFQIS